jgi:hypothetical protein
LRFHSDGGNRKLPWVNVDTLLLDQRFTPPPIEQERVTSGEVRHQYPVDSLIEGQFID